MNARLRRAICWAVTLSGTIPLCIAARSWRDPYHAAYDVLAGLVFFSFVGQLVADALERRITRWWWSRAALALLITAISVGALVWRWEISGHLTGLLIVAGAQSLERRLSALTRVLYWMPVPIALWLRWTRFDGGVHTETYSAAIAAALCLTALMLLCRASERR